MTATVTAIVPTFNRPDLIGDSIESALAQTYEDLVVLVGDNGGSPETEAVVRAYDDPRVRYVRHERNLGGQGNWLELIRLADTPLVASLHDDDTWEPTYLAKTVPHLLEDPTLGMVFTDFWCVDDEGHRLEEHTEWLCEHSGRDRLPAGRLTGSHDDLLRVLVLWNAPQPAFAAVLRRSSVMDTVFPPEIDPVYDLWTTTRMLARGEGFYYVPERLTNYRVWSGSVTAGGYGTGLDAALGHIVAENPGSAEVVDEINARWAHQRFGRARLAMDDPSQRERSQRDMRAASAYLSGTDKILAEVAGRSTLGWEAVRNLRRAVRAARGRVQPERLSTSGLPERLTRPDSRAKALKS